MRRRSPTTSSGGPPGRARHSLLPVLLELQARLPGSVADQEVEVEEEEQEEQEEGGGSP